MRKGWNNYEIKYLIENYEKTPNDIIVKHLNREIDSITSKSYCLKLHKNKEFKLLVINAKTKEKKERKIRILTYELLKEIALKYKTKSEFVKNDPSAYTTSTRRGILNDICSHMLTKRFSTPQLLLFEILKILIPNTQIEYDDRIAIGPYEIDIYLPKFKLGFEYNGIAWHTNNKKDTIKNNLCEEKNIHLITIFEKSKNYFHDIIDQLINNVGAINLITNLNIKNDEILSIDKNNLYEKIKNNILNINDAINIIKKYKYFKEFRFCENKLYESLKRKHLIGTLCCNLIRTTVKWNISKVIETASKYENYSDFVRLDHNCYIYVMKHNLYYLLNNLKKKTTLWNFGLIKSIITTNRFNYISDLEKKHSGALNYLRKNNFIEECKIFIKEQKNLKYKK